MSQPASASLESLVAEVLDLPVSEISDTAGHDTLPEWTSLANIQVINAVEEAYDVTLSTQELVEATSVGRLRAVLRTRGVNC